MGQLAAKPMPSPHTPRRPWLALLALFLLGLAPRCMPLEHGLPRNYVPDTHIVRAALGMAKDKDLIPPVGKYSTYPNVLPYLLLPVYAGEYVFGRVTGRFAGPGEFQAQVLEQPGRVQWLARVLVALLSALAPLGAYALARAAGLGAAAWLAGFLMATALLHVHFSVQERPWGPLVSALLFCAAAAAKVVAGGRAQQKRDQLPGPLSGIAAQGTATPGSATQANATQGGGAASSAAQGSSATAVASLANAAGPADSALLTPDQQRSTGRWLVASAVAAGLGFGLHQAGLPLAALTALAWAFAPWPWRGGAALWLRLRWGLLALLAWAVVGIGIGHPYLLRYGVTPTEVVSGADVGAEALQGAIRVGGQGMLMVLRPASALRLSQALFGYDPLIAVAGLLGLFLAFKRRALWPALLFLLGWAAIFFTNQNDHVRYILPVTALLVLPAALALEQLWKRGPLGRGLLVLLLALPVVQAARFVHVLSQPDTRALAETLLLDLPAGSRVAIDRYGPLPDLDQASLKRIAALRPLGSRERHRLDMLEAGLKSGGLSALPLEDLYRFDERHRGVELANAAAGLDPDPNRLLRNEGITHVLLVDRDPLDGRPPILIDPAPAETLSIGPNAGQPAPKLPPLHLSATAPLWVLDAGGSDSCSEARLPTELDFPLISLWQLERPGPRLELWEFP